MDARPKHLNVILSSHSCFWLTIQGRFLQANLPSSYLLKYCRRRVYRWKGKTGEVSVVCDILSLVLLRRQERVLVLPEAANRIYYIYQYTIMMNISNRFLVFYTYLPWATEAALDHGNSSGIGFAINCKNKNKGRSYEHNENNNCRRRLNSLA